jgi:hypothetical protein
MFPTISATRIQRWWKSLVSCTDCGILIPRDNFNCCDICYHSRHEDMCDMCNEGKQHKWNPFILAKQKRLYEESDTDDEPLSITYIPQTSDEE